MWGGGGGIQLKKEGVKKWKKNKFLIKSRQRKSHRSSFSSALVCTSACAYLCSCMSDVTRIRSQPEGMTGRVTNCAVCLAKQTHTHAHTTRLCNSHQDNLCGLVFLPQRMTINTSKLLSRLKIRLSFSLIPDLWSHYTIHPPYSCLLSDFPCSSSTE